MNATHRHRHTRALIWMITYIFALLSTQAHAQLSLGPILSPKPDTSRPWAAGVSDNEQAIAFELYVAGNLEFTESRFAQALAKYKEALRHWDHPAIRFNMAVCLINLNQPLEAKDNLDRSLAYGARPLEADLYQQGITYRTLLDAQLAHVRIVCQEPDTQVTLDGKLLLAEPGTVAQLLLPGEHQVVATKVGLLTVSKTLVLIAGKLTTYEIRPLELAAATRVIHRWEPWTPWAVLAGGGALVGAGALMYFAAMNNLAAYDNGITTECPKGCSATTLAAFSGLRQMKDRARIEQLYAFTLFSLGGTVVIASMIILHTNLPDMQLQTNRVLPVVEPIPGGATVTMNWRF